MLIEPGTRVLVTGGAGFIGRRLTARLVDGGAHVTVTTGRAVTDVAGLDGATLVQVALHDAHAARELVRRARPQVVFHLASAVTGSRSIDALRPTFDLTLSSTVALLEALVADGTGARLVHAGSLEEPPAGDPSAPSSPYAAAKAASTAYLRMAHALYGLPVTIARIFMVYGPGPQDTERLVPYVIRSLLRGEPPGLSSGTRPVDWVFVDDVVEGLLRIATAHAATGATVDLGSGTLTTVRAVAERIADLVGGDVRPTFGALGDRPHEQVRAADLTATRASLGWAPATALDDGLAATVAWFRGSS